MRQKVFLGITAVSAAAIVVGYLWLNAIEARDGNFGPPILIIGGFVGLVAGLVGAVVQLLKYQSRR